MGFRLKVSGGDISFDERAILKVDFMSESPHDTNARATDFSITMKIWGKILYDEEESSDTIKLSQWSQVPAEESDCYRDVELQIVSASQVVRGYKLPNAFVMDYTEECDVDTGVGTFFLHVKQKKDKNSKVEINGEFAEQEGESLWLLQ